VSSRASADRLPHLNEEVPQKKARVVLVAVSLLLPPIVAAQAQYDRHVAFDNSLADKSHYYSEGSYVPPTELELVADRFPIGFEKD
jgi:hypothetical protein